MNNFKEGDFVYVRGRPQTYYKVLRTDSDGDVALEHETYGSVRYYSSYDLRLISTLYVQVPTNFEKFYDEQV